MKKSQFEVLSVPAAGTLWYTDFSTGSKKRFYGGLEKTPFGIWTRVLGTNKKKFISRTSVVRIGEMPEKSSLIKRKSQEE